jgi:hypothetical protein
MQPLSHSSANLLATCQQKFLYYKSKVKPDTVEDSTALAIGKAFHYVLETTKHERPESFGPLLDHCETAPDIGLKRENRALVHAMLIKYLRLHLKSGLKVVAIEQEIRNSKVLGFIDAVMLDEATGKWWIVDMKTASYLHSPKVVGLVRDPQLNLYSVFAGDLAKRSKLDPAGFAGCRYRCVTKSTAKQKAGESDVDYIKRLLNTTVKAYDILIPEDLLDTHERMSLHLQAYDMASKIISGKLDPVRNYNSCLAWNRPCEYWSNCYGKPHAQMEGLLTIISEE